MKQNHRYWSKPNKVFGIGLGRTGTKSLTYALNHLGIHVTHYPEDADTYRELSQGNYQFSLLKTLDGITDVTVSLFYPHLDRQYPGSKFILTVRNKDCWLESLEKHWKAYPCFDESMPDTPENRIRLSVRQLLCATIFGCYFFSRDRASYVYDLHYKNVTDYFKNRPDDLLIIDICAGQGWEELCPFLGYPIQVRDFPRIREKEELNSLIYAPSYSILK
ncbi:MAG: sulfotransferase [Leptolyngbyaceae bacterium]|nr:sulfotransferase [Leptolyngbyaceae bacterium]